MRLGLVLGILLVVGCGGGTPDIPSEVPPAAAGKSALAGTGGDTSSSGAPSTSGDGGTVDPGTAGEGDEPSAGAPPASDGGLGGSAGRGGAPSAQAGAGGRAGGSGGPAVAGSGAGGGAAGHPQATGGMSGGGAGGTGGSGAAGAPVAGMGGDAGTRSLLGCGKSASGYPCEDGSYLWLCPDAAKPVGSYTVPTGSTVVTECTATPNVNEWCCTKAGAILDTRLDPATSCPTPQRPFQQNTKSDGDYLCIGTL